MKKEYFYKAYNLNVKSNIAIVDLKESDLINTQIDIHILAKEIINNEGLEIKESNQFNFDNNIFTLVVKDIAKYIVSSGNSINVEYSSEARPEEINLFLLGSALGVVLYKKNYLPLHASAIETEKGCVFFSGDSGMGKSTTLNSFIKRGYKMISDDVVALNIIDNIINIYPSFPRVKIWEDAADKLGIDTSNLRQIYRDMNKFSNPINDDTFSDKVSKPYIFYEINKTESNEIYIEQVEGLEKIKVLYKNTYRPYYISNLNKQKQHFEQISTLAENLIIKKVYRPENINSMHQITELLEKDFNL